MAPAATARVLVRNLESDTSPLRFSNFTVEALHDYRTWEAVSQGYFPEATRGDWMLRRDYSLIPPVADNSSGCGAIAFEVEDLLLALRLYRPGDLAFAGLHLQTPSRSDRLYPYRTISGLVGASTRRFKFAQADCTVWERFEAPLRASAQWNSGWFEVARRFFLYGGGKEFNPNFHGDVDRVIDYATALEAALVPESDFVSRRLRERAIRLLGLEGETASAGKELLTDMYGIRSTLVHGGPLNEKQMALLRDQPLWWKFEQIVRDVLVGALRNVPSNESGRRSYLGGVYDVCDAERVERLREDFKAIKNEEIKRDLLCSLR